MISNENSSTNKDIDLHYGFGHFSIQGRLNNSKILNNYDMWAWLPLVVHVTKSTHQNSRTTKYERYQ
jgi:hypothetical protein